MPTILGRLTGVSFQTELLVMTFLGLVNSVRSWRSFHNWTRMIEKTRNINLKSEYSEVVKTVLCWVVIARIIIAHLYTVTYLANFYPILTRCRANVLLPWMIVSGFQNFILEFIVIVVGLLLYLENEFTIAWLVAFIVCKVLFLVPAVYYWRNVKTFFVEIFEIQRRKLTRANLASNAEAEFGRSVDIGQRLRFRPTFAEGFAYRQQRFISLVKLGDIPLSSSFESDGERVFSKLSRSLETLESQESRRGVRSQEDSSLLFEEDASLTPVEKSLRILGMNRDDINETRVRLGMNVLPPASSIEDIEEIVSTVEPKDTIEAVGDRSTEHAKIDASTANAILGTGGNNVETVTLSRNVDPKDEAHSTSKVSKQPARNSSPGCSCRKARKRSVVEGTVDPDRNRTRPPNDNSREGRGSAYDEDDVDSSENADLPEDDAKHSEKPLPNEPNAIEPVKSNLVYPEDPKSAKAVLFSVDDDHLVQDNLETTDSYMSILRSHDVQSEGSLLRVVDNRRGICTQTDFVNDAGQWRSSNNLADGDFLPGTTKLSTSTQTDISYCWSETIFKRKSCASIDLDKDSFRSKPPGRASLSKAMLFTDMTKLSRPKNRLEAEEEREAREMRALRIYNRRTLFKYKREIEAREQNSALGNRVALQSLIFTAKPKPRERKASSEMVQVRSDQIPKSQERSRPQHRTSKLSAFNLGLDDLEYAISSSFSSKKKNRTRRHDSINSSNENPPISSRKQLSKYNKPTRIPEGLQRSSPSMTRFEGLRKGRYLDRTPGAENITVGKITGEIDRENCSSDIVKPIDRPESHDKHGISSLKEMIKNIDWGFNDHHDSKINDAPPQDNFVCRGDDVLYDIIDDTDVISLLQSAFASNPANTERGFYLGPGSTELYSVTNYLDDVVGEIMKTARLRPNPDAFANEPTTEVDYGDSYLEEFQVTRLSALKGTDEGTDSESDASNDIKIEDFTPAEPTELDHRRPIEMCWSSYSGEGLVPEDHRQSSSSKNSRVSKGIADFLGEKEISSLEFWTRELKNLASNERRNDLEFTKNFRHLIEIPGYCVVKTLVDFFREFVTVSRSTMTSRRFIGDDQASTSSSLRSEEIISGGLNDHSNVSLVNSEPVDPQSMTLLEIIDEDVADFLRKLIDRLTENAEVNDRRNSAVVGIHDDRTTFPLREDQFYFGQNENTRLVIKENLLPKCGAQNHRFIRNEEIQAYHLANLQSPQANASSTISNPEVRNGEAVSASSLQTSAYTDDTSVTAKGLHSIALTSDSYDSFYSSGAADSSKHSDNVISIDGESTFEDFLEDTPNANGSISSQPRFTAHLSNSEN